MWRRNLEEPLVIEPLAPGAPFHFEPRQEHCLIAAENLLLFEWSIGPRGMGQDTIFIYETRVLAMKSNSLVQDELAVAAKSPR